MSFAELLRHPPFRRIMSWGLMAVILLAGTLIWYFKIGKKRESQHNEKQRKHAFFRRICISLAILGAAMLPSLNLPEIYLRNGRMLSVELLVGFGGILLFYAIIGFAGRLIFGEEGRLKPKKEKS
ncbi:MAG: hypothetical protein FWE98_08110 [Oscillospiraceae bacterium]|nr:hypothetical protein [Oscillospiraceae bacterium]